MRRPALIVWLLLACGRSGGEEAPASLALLRGPAADDRPVDVARAASDPDELLRALAAPHGATAGRLGPHRYRGTQTVRVREAGKDLEALDEETSIDWAGPGALHAVYRNSRDYGRELVRAGDTIWVRPRWGKFHRRPPVSDDEAARVATEIQGALGAAFELVAHAAALRDGGEARVDGRPARRIGIALGPPRPRARPEAGPRAWRADATVTALEGELALDAETGALLEGRLETAVTFVREGRTLELALAATHRISGVGAAIEIAPPPGEESAPTPARLREVEERQGLLDGLAAPPAPRGGRR